MNVTKKVNLKLVGLDSNAFTIMGAFRQQALKEGWTKAEIDEVIKECISGDYNHLLATILSVTDDNQEDDDEEDEDESDEEED